jgi:hypothetical protein
MSRLPLAWRAPAARGLLIQDPGRRRHQRRDGHAAREALGVCRVGRGEQGRALGDALLGQAIMHVGGRQQPEAGVPVLRVDQPSMYSKMAKRASTWVVKRRRSRSSHSRDAKKLSHRALS